MTVSRKSSVDSRKKGGKSNTLAAGKDVPFVTPRPGGFLKISKNYTGGIGAPLFSSTAVSGLEDFDPNCTCRSAVCHDPHKKLGSVTIQASTPENSTAHMQSFALSGTETTREFRIHQALKSEWEVSSVGEAAESDEDLQDGEEAPVVNLLAVLISTLMLLASGNSVPTEVLHAVESYLRCVTDEEDNTPPNVQGLLNYLSMIKGDSQVEKLPEEKSAVMFSADNGEEGA